MEIVFMIIPIVLAKILMVMKNILPREEWMSFITAIRRETQGEEWDDIRTRTRTEISYHGENPDMFI